MSKAIYLFCPFWLPAMLPQTGQDVQSKFSVCTRVMLMQNSKSSYKKSLSILACAEEDIVLMATSQDVRRARLLEVFLVINLNFLMK